MKMKKRLLNILHIRDSSGMYGSERVILTLTAKINRSQFNPVLVCLKNPDGKSDELFSHARDHGIDVQAVDVSGRFDPCALRKIRNLIRSKHIDIIHTHDFKSDLYGLLASLGLGVKRVATAHGSTRDSLLKRLYLFFDERMTYRFFDRIIAVSQDLATQLKRKHVPEDKIAIIQNGLDTRLMEESVRDMTQCEPPLNVDEKCLVFAVIGRLFPDKGHRFFLEAFARLKTEFPNITGLIVGDGPARDQIAAQLHSLQLDDSVIMCGVRHDMKDIYSRVDFLVIPSLTEGLPYVLLEAMASGIPVLATAVGDIPFLIQDGITGYLVAPGDIDTLAERMRDLLMQTENARAMGLKGQALVIEQFSAQRMVRLTEELYGDCLGV